ncbi:FAD-binding oxidoreductase [Altererythrobacter sp. RZ02]|uniref:FAD-binding oxidoreductase n=1 Tax=Pontixanthobacter rizhaonensis TaxID=2730337 RepID=A0A848QRG4_9SPHN|nr:FAD-binding oxidoreductase [Pontixanthobacter rizhaonensis]NMW31688.1 FAD-binding oxidoreductase [Pontixanthobacter rizhaonensis]
MIDYTAFISAAHDVLGPRGFTCDADLIDPWLTDWRGRYTGKAIGMASPQSTEQVSQLVRLCAQHGVNIVPQGGNSGMSGGATPDASGTAIILSLRQLNDISPIDPNARQVTCGAGVILQSLHTEAEQHDLRFPLTLGGKGSATIGGLISTNAGGTQVLRHGTMREQVAGIEAVMADGQIYNSLTPLKKDNRGFDLKQLLIGSEGTLGIVTAATLFLSPRIGGRTVLWVGLPKVQNARDLLIMCKDMCGDGLEGFEILPDHCLSAVLDYLPSARNPLSDRHRWYALIEIVAGTDNAEALNDLAESVLAKALESSLIEDGTYSANETQAEAFWLLRDSISPAERAIGPAMQHDISVPVSRMADFIADTVPRVENAFPGTAALAFGHLGDGNVHYHVLAPKGAIGGVWEEEEGKQISIFVHDCVTEWNGSISAEHGIGQMKRDELGRLGDPAALSILRSVKNALDPQGLLNPGKLIPAEPT